MSEVPALFLLNIKIKTFFKDKGVVRYKFRPKHFWEMDPDLVNKGMRIRHTGSNLSCFFHVKMTSLSSRRRSTGGTGTTRSSRSGRSSGSSDHNFSSTQRRYMYILEEAGGTPPPPLRLFPVCPTALSVVNCSSCMSV